ncbi:IclR family transcriptional regulator C-terminal domain-containing protein [Streptomyces sp. NPDC058682]|uniref:IclR family transcriptional regulator domain-containing protein n=1 Tax=unclassified Streptomyces TaxID=2593676 RepID=UPI00338EF55C
MWRTDCLTAGTRRARICWRWRSPRVARPTTRCSRRWPRCGTRWAPRSTSAATPTARCTSPGSPTAPRRPEAPRVYEWIDFRFAGHASAVGTSLLQQLPFEARMDHLARRHPVRLTPRTIADQAGLFRSIAHGGPRSVQFDGQEHSPREVCVAVPLSFGQAEALALSLPASQRHRRTTPPPPGSRPDPHPTRPHSPVRHRPAQPPPQRQLTRPAAITVRTGPDRHPAGPKPHSDVCAGPRGRRSP